MAEANEQGATYPAMAVRQPGRAALLVVVQEPLTVGRDCDGLLVADEKVSRQHFRVTPDGASLHVVDLGSTNGTFLERVRVTGEMVMTPGMELQIGDTTIHLETAALSSPVSSAQGDSTDS